MEDEDQKQEEVWTQLHHAVTETLAQYGTKNAFGEGDYWINDDNYGWARIQVGIQNLNLYRPAIVHELRSLLSDLPGWAITMAVDVVGKEKSWPLMGVTIRKHEIIDGLNRDILPEVFRTYHYADSRPGTGYD